MKHLCGKCLLDSSSAAIVKTASDWKELQKREFSVRLIFPQNVLKYTLEN